MTESEKLPPIEIIPKDAQIKLIITGDFYARLQQLFLEGMCYKDQNHFLECVKKLSSKEPQEDRLLYHMQTMIALITTIEQSAKHFGITVKGNLNPETQEFTVIEDSKG